MATIRDVAKHASVSPATVSQVLRNSETVHPRTKRIVEQAIADLGYRRRGVGQPPKHAKPTNIGIAYRHACVSKPMAFLPWRWFDAVYQELQARGYHVSLFGGPTDGLTDPVFRSVVEQGRLHGVIFIGGADRKEDVEWASGRDLPTVVIHRRPQNYEFSYVDIDNAGGAAKAVDHFVENGHRRIAMVCQTQKTHFHAQRVKGYEKAIKAHGLTPYLFGPTGAVSYADICQELINAEVTAVFCIGDRTAESCMQQLHAMGVRVPQDMSIIGFDDLGLLSPDGLRLTSIGVNIHSIARTTIDMLQRLIRDKGEMHHLSAVIRTHLMKYDTVIPLPGASGDSAVGVLQNSIVENES